jgi:hypothetical protein
MSAWLPSARRGEASISYERAVSCPLLLGRIESTVRPGDTIMTTPPRLMAAMTFGRLFASGSTHCAPKIADEDSS